MSASPVNTRVSKQRHVGRRERHARRDENEHAAEQHERPEAGVGQIGEREAADRGRERAVQAKRCVSGNGQRRRGRGEPRLETERRPAKRR